MHCALCKDGCPECCPEPVMKQVYNCPGTQKVIRHQHIVKHQHDIINEYDIIHEHEYNTRDVVREREVVKHNNLCNHQPNYCPEPCSCGKCDTCCAVPRYGRGYNYFGRRW